MGQRIGDQVWVNLEAERVEEDGFAEGLAISVRPGLVEIQRNHPPSPTSF